MNKDERIWEIVALVGISSAVITLITACLELNFMYLILAIWMIATALMAANIHQTKKQLAEYRAHHLGTAIRQQKQAYGKTKRTNR